MDMARKKKMVTLTLDPELVQRLEAWLEAQEFPPAKNAVIEAALKAWLDSRENGPAQRQAREAEDGKEPKG